MNKGHLARAKDVAYWRLRRVWPVLAIGLASFLLELAGDSGRLWGRYDGALALHGEYWRLITGHVVHLGWTHLWPNLTALALMGALFEDLFDATTWWWVAGSAAASIDVGLFLFENDVEWYVGLSGVLHGFVAAGALLALLRGQSIGGLLALGLVAKLTWEQAIGPVAFTAANVGGAVIVAAHLWGAAGGLLAGAVTSVVRSRTRRV